MPSVTVFVLVLRFSTALAVERATRRDERRGYSDFVLLPIYVASTITLDQSLHPVEASLATNGDDQSGAWSVNRGRVWLLDSQPTLRRLYTPGREGPIRSLCLGVIPI